MTTSGGCTEIIFGRKSSNWMGLLPSVRAGFIKEVVHPCLDTLLKHASAALIDTVDAEGVGRKAILPSSATGTPNIYCAKEGKDGIIGILPELVNGRKALIVMKK